MCKRFISLLLLVIFLLGFCIEGFAAAPLPVKFRKHGGGQFIYCNNPENLEAKDLSTTENPNATYLLKNEGLKPDNYSVFFCFYNWTDFDVEPDIEFITGGNAVITINSVGYYLPRDYEYFDCIGAWSDLLGINIRTLNGYEQYVPYKGGTILPGTINLQNSSDWISRYIYNYDVIKPHTTFNMLVNFTIESGEADVNFAALKNYGVVGDRSHHNPNALPGQYYNDTSIKGIETESLPIVENDFDINIDGSIKNGDNIPVGIFNQYYNNGNIMPHFMTNINPSRDMYSYSKKVAAGSDMLSFKYKDDKKLTYYGKNVPADQRDNIWIMDIYHHNTTSYEKGMPWNEDEYKPNDINGYTLDVNNLPKTQYEFNLGNFGVTNRYNLTITNNDSVSRVLNYMLETALSSNIVVVKDEDGNLLNPFTLEKDNAFALCKGNNSQKKEDCMFSAEIKPNETKKYTLDVILPTNCYGGMINAFRVSDQKLLTEFSGTSFPDYNELYQYNDLFYNGERYMKWDGGDLYQYSDQGNWEQIILPDSAKNIVDLRSKEFKFIKTPDGYLARFSGWDGFGGNVANKQLQNKVYFFDNNFNLIKTVDFPDYIYDFICSDNEIYVLSDKKYVSTDGDKFNPIDNKLSFPLSNGKYTVFKSENDYLIKNKDVSSKICCEGEAPKEILSSGNLFYYLKSWKAYYKDTSTKNILSVSKDGVNWTDLYFPDKFYDIKKVDDFNGKINVNCKYESFAFDDTLSDNVKVNLNNELLSFTQPAKIVNDRTMVPLRYFFEKLNATVTWNDETQEITVAKDENIIRLKIGSDKALVNGEEKVLDVPLFMKNDKTMIPLRFLSENLGYNVSWDENTSTAFITTSLSELSTKRQETF